MSEQLSWPRLAALLRNGVILSWRNWLIGLAATSGLLLIGAMAAVNHNGPDHYYRTCFYAMLFLWGTIASSVAFSDLHDKSKNTAYLLLPASALEKTLAPLISMTIALVAALLVFTTVASVAIEGINWLVYHRTNDLFSPFERETWTAVARYLVVQSWFFLGAVWFRKAHYIRTLLAIVVGFFSFVGLVALASWIAGLSTFTPSGMQMQAGLYEWLFFSNPAFGEAALVSLAILWSVALPIFCWCVAWLRIAETQVSHGV